MWIRKPAVQIPPRYYRMLKIGYLNLLSFRSSTRKSLAGLNFRKKTQVGVFVVAMRGIYSGCNAKLDKDKLTLSRDMAALPSGRLVPKCQPSLAQRLDG